MSAAKTGGKVNKIIILSLTFLIAVACQHKEPEPNTPPAQEIETGKKLNLWATMYYVKEVKPSSSGIPMRDLRDKVIGPKLDRKTWCLAAMEGTVKIGDAVYNYAGVRNPRQTHCDYAPSEKVRWKKTEHPYGIGNRNNPLKPFKSIATDTSVIPSGTKIFIPSAKSVKYEVGGESYTHDGVFYADDVGGKIKGNHIDIFLGVVEGGLRGAMELNPFKFIKSTESGTFEAYIVK